MTNGKLDPAYQRLQEDIVVAGGLAKQVKQMVSQKSNEFPNKFPELNNFKNKLLVVRVNEMVEWLISIGATKEQYTPDIGKKVVFFCLIQ